MVLDVHQEAAVNLNMMFGSSLFVSMPLRWLLFYPWAQQSDLPRIMRTGKRPLKNASDSNKKSLL